MKHWAWLLLAICAPLCAQMNDAQEQRYRTFTHHLRCLVCQNQTIADSNAPLAEDLREQVKKQILEGRSDAQITQYLTDRYGDFVLYQPPFKARTALLWLGPGLLLLVALAVAFRVLRGSHGGGTQPVDPVALQKLLDQNR